MFKVVKVRAGRVFRLGDTLIKIETASRGEATVVVVAGGPELAVLSANAPHPFTRHERTEVVK